VLVQSPPTLHVVPVLHLVGQLPPQSVPVSLPFLMVSLQVGAAHLFDTQCAEVQSESAEQARLSAHFGQLPPQSLSVSLPFFTMSPQLPA
jgi:hypothetical protein